MLHPGVLGILEHPFQPIFVHSCSDSLEQKFPQMRSIFLYIYYKRNVIIKFTFLNNS